MRTRSVAFALSLLAAGGIVRPASADPRNAGDVAAGAARDIWHFIQQIRGEGSDTTGPVRSRPQASQPQAIPQAAPQGLTLDLSDLSHPLVLEEHLTRLADMAADDMRVTVPNGTARLGAYSVGSDQSIAGHLLVVRGDAQVFGRLQGNLVTYDGDIFVHPGAVISGDVLAIHGTVHDRGGEIGGESRTLSAVAPQVAAATPPLSAGEATLRRLAGVVGVFLALAALGVGLAAFGRNNLQVVSDTVSHSFGRAFVTGLVGQILILPTFGMLVVGLVLSVAGILLLPFAVAVYVLLVIVGVVGGYLAVAHAMGETYTRRRLAQGILVGAPGSYQFLLVGLVATTALWLAWALFGWVPVAGSLIRGAAILITWLLATAGLGAALLSRAGIRENFAGRIIPPEALTDEYLWATPQFGVPAVKRPGTGSRATGQRE
ncbi:MAG TPA: polymer-forming cytoskeletal protein [Gemmatimonadales bacterium]|nr:polymer-forming cytoskeletal protein [Gemmatimonadales bacterium]